MWMTIRGQESEDLVPGHGEEELKEVEVRDRGRSWQVSDEID